MRKFIFILSLISLVLLSGCGQEEDIKLPSGPDTGKEEPEPTDPNGSYPNAMTENFGVNLSGAEFGGVYPGVIGTHYGYPTASCLDLK